MEPSRHDFDRRIVIVAICGLVPAFMCTDVLVKLWKGQRRQFTIEWTQRGEDAIARHRADEAVHDFQNALAYQPNDVRNRLRLAEAFMIANQREDARRLLSALYGDHPDDGTINLNLARLGAGDGDTTAAVRFCRAAIRGAWPPNSVRLRWAAQAGARRAAV